MTAAWRTLWGKDLNDLLRLAGPVMLARIGAMVLGLTDAVVVGHFSAEQLGFHALGWAPTAVVLTAGVGLLSGVQVVTSQKMGEGRPDLAGAALRRGLVYAFWLGVASALLLGVVGPLALPLLKLDARLTQGAQGVMAVFAFSLPCYLIASVATLFLEALKRPMPGVILMWAANVVNLILNLLLVPGVLGLPALGAVGAAWATFGSRAALMVGMLVWIARLPDARSLGVFAKPAPDRETAVRQRRVGYGAGASLCVEVTAFSAMTVIAGWVGGLTVASWAIVLNVASLIFMAPLGLSNATAIIVGRAVGADDPAHVRKAALTAFAATLAISAAISMILWPGARLISAAYTSDPAVLALTVGALAAWALVFVPDALQVVAAQALRARGDVLVPTITHTISYAVVMMPLGWWLAVRQGWGLGGIVTAVGVASVLAAGLLLGRFWMLRSRLAAA